MPDFLFANNASSTLAVALDTLGVTIILAAGSGARFPDPIQYAEEFVLTLKSQTTDEVEIVYCYERNDDVLNITRAREGTVALSFGPGDVVAHQMTAGMFSYLRDL